MTAAGDVDPASALLRAAHQVLAERGMAALTVREVLQRSNLATRAFYRHFQSKDHLVIALFAESARLESIRLRAKMADTTDPVRAVVAWIDGRLDLAFDEAIESDLRHVSSEARAVHELAPQILATAYVEIVSPLAEELRRGRELGFFPNVDPVTDAEAIQSVAWACVERQWAAPHLVHREVRASTIAFCLRAIGTDPEQIQLVI